MLSAITWHELMYGLSALGNQRRTDLNAVYNGFVFACQLGGLAPGHAVRLKRYAVHEGSEKGFRIDTLAAPSRGVSSLKNHPGVRHVRSPARTQPATPKAIATKTGEDSRA